MTGNSPLIRIKNNYPVLFIGVIVPYEISKVSFRVETKILVSMSEEI
jgi:hypothetical protein